MQTGDKKDAEKHRQLKKPGTVVVQPGSTSSGTAVLKTYNNPPLATCSLLKSAFIRDWKVSPQVPPEAMQLLPWQNLGRHRAVRGSTAAKLGLRELPSHTPTPSC